ncbi:hypothetical protein GGI19_002974 [Coemansia pectinata]|uniref:Uncharacterized protein n=1 Tax=Coemansia pectinata TaxID=1052879 RepID=A0A9W8LBZ8_9FUNG|nr:hypothetical protein GGI19_002974 [Coemansia pectinata]
MCDGVFCDVISTLQAETVSFPSANTLVVYLDKTTEEESGGSAATSQEKVVDFARSLLRLAPAVTNIIFNFSYVSDRVSEYARLYNTLVSELYQGGVTSLEVYSELDGPPLLLSLRDTLGLTSITHGPRVSCAPFAKLAYLNADTLKVLSIKPETQDDWLLLIYGDTETPAVYSSLITLTLDMVYTPYDTSWTAIEEAEPFPALSTLALVDGYPFDDDLLFRGNGMTLQNLQIPFGAIARNILGRFGVLRRSGVTQMRSVRVSGIFDEDDAFMSENANVPIRQQVHRIMEVVTSLSLLSDVVGHPLFKSIKAAPKTSSLRHLGYTDEIPTLGGIISVVSALPSLVILTCQVQRVGSTITNIPVDERPRRLREKHYPLSDFRVLRIPHATEVPAEEIAYAAMLLAVLCPNLVQVDLPPGMRNVFGREIAWAMINDPFKPYSESISRLIYREVKN